MSAGIGSAWGLAGTQSRRQIQAMNALLHYSGNAPRPLRMRPGDPDDNVQLNFAALVVDTGVSYLFGRDVGVKIGSDRADAPTPHQRAKSKTGTVANPNQKAQDWLDACWEYNKRALTLQKLAVNGGIAGHCFLKIVPQPKRSKYPRLVVLDSSEVKVAHDPDDIERVYKYTIGGDEHNSPYDPTELEDDPGKRYELPTRQVIQDNGYKAGATDWTPAWVVLDQQYAGSGWTTNKTTPWPYPFPPIVDAQNLPAANDQWGTPDLTESVTHLLGVINRNVSHYNKVMRIYAHPKWWTRGMGNKPIDTSIDATINLPSETAEMHLLEMQSEMTANANFIQMLLEHFSYITRVPMVAMGMPDGQGVLSGVALEIRYQPLIQKTDTKRRTYGDLVIELSRRLLVMQKLFSADADIDLTIEWPDLLPSDPLALRQSLAQDMQMGVVSKRTVADRLDYDYDAEQAEIDAEHAHDVASQLADQQSQQNQQLAHGLKAQDAQNAQSIHHQQNVRQAFPDTIPQQPGAMSGGSPGAGATVTGSPQSPALQSPAPPPPPGAKH